MDILTAQNLAYEMFTAKPSRIKELSETEDIFFSYPALIRVQRLIASGKIKAGAGEFLLLNGIASSIVASPLYYSAGNITTNEKDIADTVADMMSKYAFFYPDYSSPCSVQQAFELGKRAVEHKRTRSFSMAELSLLSGSCDEIASLNAALKGFDIKHCQDGICVAADQHIKKRATLKPNKKYFVSFVCPREDSGFENMLEFAKAVPSLKNTVSSFADERYKLFAELLNHSQKLSITSDAIPVSSESKEIFSSITDFLFDKKCTIAVISKYKRSSKRKLNALASKNGVDIYHLIETTKQPVISVVFKRKVLASLPSDALKALMVFEALSVNIPNQFDGVVNLPHTSVYESKETKESVYMTKVSLADPSSLFLNTTNSFIAPFLASVYDGKSTENSEFSISVNARLSSKVENSYAALLGIYRSITEMGVLTENPSITLTDGEPSLSVALRVHTFGESSSFETELSQNELYDSFICKQGVPDFSVLRDLINGKNLEK